MTLLSTAKLNAYVVEQFSAALNTAKVNAYVVEQALPITGLFTKFGGVWRSVTPYANLPVMRTTEAGDARVTEDGSPRKLEPLNSGAAWVAPYETYIKSSGVWKKVLPLRYLGEP